jgi:hypothetical protein
VVRDVKAADGETRVAPDRPTPKPNVPTGAVARCRNGGFVFVATGANTCKNAGGVAEWFVKQ